MIKDIKTIREELNGFDEVEMPFDFKIGTRIKYITVLDNVESFYTGGNYVRMVNEKIVLSNGGPDWRVPTVLRDNNCKIIYNSRFFIPNLEEEVLSEKTQKHYEKIIETQQRVIDKMTEIIRKDKLELQKYKN